MVSPSGRYYDSIERYEHIEWRNDTKILKHPRDKVGDYQRRVLIHIPIGLLIGIPILGYPVLKLFIRYEENEDAHTKDQAWKDYAGAIAGACITVIITIALTTLIILKLIGVL